MKKLLLVFLVISFLLTGCATYYKKTQKFHDEFAAGNLDEADGVLKKDKKGPTNKNRLLYFFNRGVVNYMLGNNQESINLLMQAERYIEDQQKNYGLEALTLISNPGIKPYKPEDFENVLVNFYMAMNFLEQGKYSSAIVEAKRINIKLNDLNDKYPANKNRYKDDAFAHALMGMLYEANNNFNDAFIAYRNAYETYKDDYTNNFSMSAPQQLKKDLIRAAYKTGFYDEGAKYEKEFGIKYDKTKHEGGELVFFWLNGLGPVKSEWSINFTVMKGQAGYVTFVNDEHNLSFPYYIGDKPSNEQSALGNLSMTRIAFPKYLERRPIYNNAEIIANGNTYALNKAEDINEIAFKTLNDRMLREMGNSLLRLATKKALEAAVNQQNQNIGTLVSIANAVTEKADTRNWQTLPYSISYTRIPLAAGENTLQLKTSGKNGAYQMQTFNFNIQKGKTTFFSYHSLDSHEARER